jgi:glycosyltransferase involved in cell wall biosynthesis
VSPSVAAVIPLYNKGPHIERALRSALEQTDPPDEIIVVDDASTDEGPDRVQRFGNRVRLLRRAEPGAGGYAARNLAIEHSGCEWIAFLDADDAWRPDYVRTMRALAAQAPEAGAVFAARTIVRSDGTSFVQTALDRSGSLSSASASHELFDFNGFVRLWLRLRRSPMWTSATLARRDALIEAGLFPAGRCPRGGDKDLWLRLARVAPLMGSALVGATYFNGTVNQVTRRASLNQQPCLCATIATWIENAAPAERALLRRLYNLEASSYAKWLFGEERLSPRVYRGFYVMDDPVTYLALTAASAAPMPLQRAVRRLIPRHPF